MSFLCSSRVSGSVSRQLYIEIIFIAADSAFLSVGFARRVDSDDDSIIDSSQKKNYVAIKSRQPKNITHRKRDHRLIITRQKYIGFF